MTREKIHPSIDRDLRRRLRAYCAAKGRDTTETSVVEAALKDYLDQDGDSAQIMRRLDRLSRANHRLQRDLDVMSEAFAVFVRLWCSYLPDIAAPEQDAAKRVAASRYQAFLDLVAQQFASGGRLVNLVVTDPVGDEAELAAVAARQAAGAGAGS